MAEKFLKTLKLPGIDEPYKIPQTAEDVGARPADWMPTAEQVGARPNTWMPNATDVGARAKDWLPTLMEIGAAPTINIGSYNDDLDYVIGNTACWVSASTINNPTNYYGLCETWDSGIGGVVQRISTSKGCVQRIKTSNGWGEWEWINPPLTPGEEHRTTERYLGKPVYVKVIDFGAWPTANSYVQVDFNTSGKTLIDIQTTGYAEANGYSTINYPTTTVQAYAGIIKLINNNSFTLAGIRGCFVVKYVYN